MQFLAAIATWSMPAFAALLLLVQILAREVGYWFGRRTARKQGGEGEGVNVMVGAMLGLLAFVLALTLSFANARFGERRAGTLAEANAIGTAWLRAEAVGGPRASEIMHLLEGYARVRAEFVRAPLDPDIIGAADRQTGELQQKIWEQISALVRERADPVTVSLMSAVNDTFDASTAQRFAYAFTLPGRLVGLLIGLALLSMAALGFQLGLRDNPLRVLGAVLTVMWTVIILSILDLGASRIGALRTSAAVYEWTIDSFQTAPKLPSPPRTPLP
ncbi:hypothetical protein E0493_09385 [Roseomonas sp. M0104]|uniref:DUF4239 domain-containing protein n=2 Tax=Teichococcus coralli TaxID=2545983 RepID=A0A845B8R2_9PROT|nr:hypothetical protein [Pseudoroseomonas coralli]